jgi:Tol biopolymer transport system component
VSASSNIDLDLRAWLVVEAPAAAPAGLHGSIVERARRSRQRGAWWVAVRGGVMGASSTTAGRTGLRLVYVLLVLGVILASVIAAIATGAFRTDPVTRPLARNGTIAYPVYVPGVRPNSVRPYDYIHLMDADGTADRAIGEGTCPTYSQDGRVLAYRTGLRDTTELHIANPDGSSPRVLVGIGDSQYALSPDGTLVAWFKLQTPPLHYIEYGKAELWVSPVDGGPGARIVPAGGEPYEFYSYPVWSPDGRYIAFDGSVATIAEGGIRDYRSAIYVVGVDGSDVRPITTRPSSDAASAISWSPDGRSIAYLGLPDGAPVPSIGTLGGPPTLPVGLPSDVFVIGVDGTGERSVTNSAVDEGPPSWSPDGTHLGYETVDGLVTVRMDGSTPAGPPRRGPLSRSFSWSPDGRMVLVLEDAIDQTQGSTLAIRTIDAEFRTAPTTLQVVETDVPCPPSWQRLEP